MCVLCQITVRWWDNTNHLSLFSRCLSHAASITFKFLTSRSTTVTDVLLASPVGTRLNDAILPILFWFIVITLTFTRPSVGPSGLGEAGGTQSIVYKDRKTFLNTLGQQKDKVKHKEKQRTFMAHIEQMWGPEYQCIQNNVCTIKSNTLQKDH